MLGLLYTSSCYEQKEAFIYGNICLSPERTIYKPVVVFFTGSTQKTFTRDGDSSDYSWCFAGVGVPPLSQHDSQVRAHVTEEFISTKSGYILVSNLNNNNI